MTKKILFGIIKNKIKQFIKTQINRTHQFLNLKHTQNKKVMIMKKILFYSLMVWLTLSLNNAHAKIDLEVRKIKEPPIMYQIFFDEHPKEKYSKGTTIITLDNEKLVLLQKINKEVNERIKFTTDQELYNKEEYWTYPTKNKGDCEDNALEKRRLLVKAGIPRGALKMGIGFHKEKLYSHGLLFIETDKGTLVLDQDNDKVVFWDEAPYAYECSERNDGMWEYYFQDWT